jgi:hypothetical protein
MKNGKHFAGFTFFHIPRSENAKADELAKAAAQKAPMPAIIFYQELTIKAIRQEEEQPSTVLVITSKDWRLPIFAYLNGTYQPQSKHEIDRMKFQGAAILHHSRRAIQEWSSRTDVEGHKQRGRNRIAKRNACWNVWSPQGTARNCS